MITSRNNLKDLGRIFFWYPVRLCIIACPYPFLHRIGRVLGLVDYFFSRNGRVRRVAKNIKSALPLPESQVRECIKQNLISHYSNNLELMKYPGMEADELNRYIATEGLEYLQTGLEKGAGVLLMTAHFGAKQLLQIFLGREGFKVNQVHHHMGREKLTFVQKHVSQRLRKKIESHLPVTFIPATGFQRKSLQCLRNNEILIVAGDGSGVKELIDTSYRPYEFLGKKMLFPTGPQAMAKRTGAEVIPVFVLREGHKHRIIFRAPISTPSGSGENDLTLRYIACFMNIVKQHPQMWDFWEEFDDDLLLVRV